MSYTDESLLAEIRLLHQRMIRLGEKVRHLEHEVRIAADPFAPTPMEELIREKETDDANEMLAEITEDTRWKN